MATTDLKLEKPGSLMRPGPVGRLLRLGFAILCLALVWDLLTITEFRDETGHVSGIIWNALVFSIFLVSYVINIGFSRDWKKWPAIITALFLVSIAGGGYAMTGNPETEVLATAMWFLDLYVFAHLGLAFLLAAIIATPGCEMRAFHDAYSKLTGVPTSEHHCPVGPLQPVDQWEARQAWIK